MSNNYVPTLFALVLILSDGKQTFSAKNDWAEGTARRADGASRDYYNRAGLLEWTHYMGDWRDAGRVVQGSQPYATVTVIDDDQPRFVEWDVTALVQEWISGTAQNQGFFLRAPESGACHFRSREHDDPSQRPQLVVHMVDREVCIAPVADTYLDSSTYRSLGDQPTLKVAAPHSNALLRFDLGALDEKSGIDHATLRLYAFAQYDTTAVSVFRCAQGQRLSDSEPTLGLAARYVGDNRIDDDQEVNYFTDFASAHWRDTWTFVGGNLDTVSSDEMRRFEPFQGRALRVKIAQGTTTAMNVGYKFLPESGSEPDEVYFRYCLRLADDWHQTVEGGKLPGISGTYGVAGWGGRKSDGRNGWSARGAFHRSIPPDNPLGGRHPIGTYCYHADMKGRYGDIWLWQNQYRGFLENNRWYTIEQYVKLNTTGKRDGIIRAWVDGRPAFEKTNIRFRHDRKLRIEQVWMNVYHGGSQPSPYDQHLYIDNVVIARKYIGPVTSN